MLKYLHIWSIIKKKRGRMMRNYSDYKSYFEELGIVDIEHATFTNRNLLIGKNGAGKSRFLKALKKVYSNENTLFLDYANLRSNISQNVMESENEDVLDLIINGQVHVAHEILGLIAANTEKVLMDLLMMSELSSQTFKSVAQSAIIDFNNYLKDLIGFEISFTNSNVYIQDCSRSSDRRTLNEMKGLFSPGENMIFILCFFLLLLERLTDKKVIIIMDEPELHLHPKALIKIIKWVYERDNVSELWLASHSLFLVPLFHFDEITLFSDGVICKRNSQMYKDIYSELIGLDDIGLFEMIKSMENWEYYRFIVECFCAPQAVERTHIGDEQFLRFVESIDSFDKSPIRVLDFGAGKLRLWDCLRQARQEGMNIRSLEYHAYEPYCDTEYINQCKNQYPDYPNVYTSINQIKNKEFDVVVMMNVLHEIDVAKWIQTFTQINKILSKNGYLVLVEVQTLKLGEQPFGNTGYILLGTEEVKTLFACDDPKDLYIEDGKKTNCWIIQKRLLDRVTRDSVLASLELLEKNSLERLRSQFNAKKIKNLESKDNIELSARKYAFWSQQYINALFAVDHIKKRYRKPALYSERIPFPGLSEDSKKK